MRPLLSFAMFKEGKPCRRCGATKRYGSSRACVVCTKERSATWRRENAEQHNDYQTQWIINRATPKWANLEAIRRVHEECERLSREMRIRFLVVHDIPLRGGNVCGLHVDYNLKVVSKSWLRTKRIQLLKN